MPGRREELAESCVRACACVSVGAVLEGGKKGAGEPPRKKKRRIKSHTPDFLSIRYLV